MYVKTPVNWVGNKYNYLQFVNLLVLNKKYDHVYDVFMGSGNLVLNMYCKANTFVGNDILPMITRLYTYMIENGNVYSLSQINSIVSKWDNFKTDEEYQKFRDMWNEKYKKGIVDLDYVYETIMLLKMCLNSTLKFNSNGEFNQAYRGPNNVNGFFNESLLKDIVKKLNYMVKIFKKKNFKFYNYDFREILKKTKEDDLILLDPPYSSSKVDYCSGFSAEDDECIFDFLKNTKSKFMYFNYLNNNGEKNARLDKVIKDNNFKSYSINNKSLLAIKNSKAKQVDEVLVTNI